MATSLHGHGEDDADDLDGIPHAVIGLTALAAVGLAVVVLIVLSGERGVATIALAMLAVPVLVSALERKAERDRDHR